MGRGSEGTSERARELERGKESTERKRDGERACARALGVTTDFALTRNFNLKTKSKH